MVDLGFTSTFDDFIHNLANNLGVQKVNRLYQCPRTKNTEHKLSGNFSDVEDSATLTNIEVSLVAPGLNLCLSKLILQFSKPGQGFEKSLNLKSS